MAKNMTDDELLALAQIGVGIAANDVPALIERYRAEVDAQSDMVDVLSEKLTAECETNVALRAEVERLTRSRDEWIKDFDTCAKRKDAAESALVAMTRERDEARRESEHWQDMADHSEAALAAAQKRVGALREALEGVCNYFSDWCYSSDDGCEAEQSANARYKARAALKESGNGDETVRPDQQVNNDA